MRDIWGHRCGLYRGPLPLVRRWLRLPFRGEVRFRVVDQTHWYVYLWRRGLGYVLESMGHGGRVSVDAVKLPVAWSDLAMLKRRTAAPQGQIVTALEMPQLFAKRWPALAEFLVATQFEDGTSRVPGELKMSNRGANWLLTLYDVEQACRLPVNAPTIEHGLGLLEQLLGVGEAPWESDQYLQTLLDRRKKKRK